MKCKAWINIKEWPYIAVCNKEKGHKDVHQSKSLYRWVQKRRPEMADGKPSVGTVSKYFGKLPGTTLVDFKNEYNQLTDKDKLELTWGIENGSLTY